MLRALTRLHRPVVAMSRPSAHASLQSQAQRPGLVGFRAFCSEKGSKKATEEPASYLQRVEKPQDFAPMTVAQKAKAGAQGTVYLGIAGFVAACGYFIVKELMPGRLSPNGVFTEAFDIVKQHHEVSARVGTPMTGFGADRNSKREGRRNFVQNDVFTDEDGIKHTRVKFNVKGPRGQGEVYAEITSENAKNEMSYIIFDPLVRGMAPMALIDNRKELSLEDKRERVVKALVACGAVMYGRETCKYTRQQRMELGDTAAQVPFVDCDGNPTDETVKKLERHPTWKIHGILYPGAYTPDDLYKIAKSPPPPAP